MLALVVLALGHAAGDTVGLGLTWLVLLPALATGLIVVTVVYGRGEKRADEKHAGRWGRAAQRRSDDA